jgi:hypothetical protein
MSTTARTETLTGERGALLETLAKHRGFLCHTVQGLTDEQAGLRPTASELCLGGLVKHVAMSEENWVGFVTAGMSGGAADPSGDLAARADGFRMLPGDTVPGLLADYQRVAGLTEEIIRTADLDQSFPLPSAPWFEPGARWSVRRVLLHILAETAQHAGHADILRETLDDQRTMGPVAPA